MITTTGINIQKTKNDTYGPAAPAHKNRKGKTRIAAPQPKKDLLKPAGFQQNVYALLLGTFAINILSLALPVMTLQVYDRILPNPGTGTLPVLVAGVCLAVVLEAVLRLSRAYVIGRTGAAYEHRMACAAMGKIINADLIYMGNYGIGEHMQRMSMVSKLKDFYNGYALSVMADLAFVPLFLVLIFYLGGPLAMLPAVILGLFMIVSFYKGARLHSVLERREKADDHRYNFLIESLEGIETLKAFALEKFFERRYEALEESSCFENYKVTQETSDTFNTGAIFSHIMVASVITAGAWFVLNGMLSTGGLIAVLLLSGRMMQPVQKALALWARYQDYKLARKHLEKLFRTPQQITQSRKTDQDIVPEGKLTLKNVSFRYQNDETPVLQDINLRLSRGDVMLLSGAHGSGKTTLLDLIAGICSPDSGEINIDGAPINTFDLEDLTRHVGYIRNTPLIFRGTIRENITCFGQIPEEKAQDVTPLLNVDKDVAKLPGGFDTFLSGNNTDVIPPGLRQRIAMTRVLATKPRLILFDNADQTLDREGYTMIYSLLARLKGKASIIMVTEDRNLRALAQTHYVLKDGRLHETDEITSTGNVRPYKELKL